MKISRTRTLVECALMAAMAVILTLIPVFRMPWGGSVTLFSMVPLVIASMRHGVKWGLLTGAVFGVIDCILGFQNVLYAATLLTQAGVIFLDYAAAYTVMGLACVFASFVPNKAAGVAVGAAVTGLLRYFCHFISGILIWGSYAPEGTPVWIYSLTYNGSYMIPEIVITVVGAVVIMRVLDRN
ncbi:MAG: energy-coupled thiamine transporter ThiT [Oscillospiraceae bacterium]|nr:energy-coupled thiamine transporter ThiT [Oscillospiraceae bacterium]